MRELKRKLAYLLVFAMVLGIMGSGSPKVYAAAKEEPTWLEAYAGAEIVNGLGGLRDDGWTVQWAQMGTAKKAVTGSGIVPADFGIKDTAWETVDENTNALDLSWVKKTKEASIVFRYTKGENKYYQVFHFNPQPKALKVGLTAVSNEGIGAKKAKITLADGYAVGSEDTGYLFFYDSTDNKAVSPATISYRIGSNGRGDMVVNNYDVDFADVLNSVKARGAKIYFTQYPAEDDNETWASKEVAYSFKKQTNAPKVVVDVAKDIVPLKAGQEFRVSTSGAIADYTEWFKVNDIKDFKDGNKLKKITLFDLPTAVSNGSITAKVTEDDVFSDTLTIQVRTAGTSTKIPSKISTVAVTHVTPMAITVTSAALTATVKDDVTIAYTIAHDPESGISVKNNSSKALQFAVVASGESISANTKWTNLKANATGKIAKNSSTKTNYKATDSIYVRVPGDKKAAKIAGQTVKFLVGDIKATEQDVKVVTSGSITKATFTELDGATPATISIEMQASTSKAIDATLSFKFTGLSEKAAKSSLKVSGNAPTSLKVPAKMQLSSGTGSIKLELPAVADSYSESTGSFTIEVEKVKVKVEIKVLKP